MVSGKLRKLSLMRCAAGIILSLAIAVTPGAAAVIKMTASVSRNTVVVGETLTFQVTVTGDTASIPKPVIPPMPGLSITSSGRSQSISFVNGKVSSSITFTYTILPRTPGKHTIQPAKLTVNGMVYETAPVLIEVVKTQAAAGSPAPDLKPVRKERVSKVQAGKQAFVRASLDKKKAYVGEAVTYIFKFYRRVRLIGDAQFAPPEVVGFVKEDLPPQKNYEADTGGQRFMVSEIRIGLFPTSAGNFTLPPASLKVTIPVGSREPYPANDFFGSFFGARGQTKVLKTGPVSLKVLPFPDAGKPSGFGGAVGSFKISSKVDSKELKVGEPFTWTVAVKGSGNIKSITEPSFGELQGFKKYESVSSLNSKVIDYRMTGSKVFQTVLVPEVSGAREVPAAEFSYFDPGAKVYRTIRTLPVPVTVAAGDQQKLTSVMAAQGTGIKLLGRDIRFIKTAGMNIVSVGPPYILKAGYWLIWLCMAGFVGVLYGWDRYRLRLVHDVRWARSRAAMGNARSQLKKASRCLKKNDDKGFYSAVSEALTGFCADKMNLSSAGITLRELAGKLMERGAGESRLSVLKELLAQCDFGRFSSSAVSAGERKQILRDASELIRWLSGIFRGS